ncbi:restriction endonuclease subunit S [Vreelandella venusta]|uniref:restriction endonuclease subunit S n=1 Tax=Vreelandella venusta TaxID=44935 RepID=UPI0018DAC2D7|nr:restriction endonuclease subunit S [Halomonas venusta]QPI64101.1 restriction endonuclease subunit S [Halomonas venusta]
MPSQTIPSGWIRAKISDIAIKGMQRKPESDESFTYVDIGSIDRSLKKISAPQVIDGREAPSRARKIIEDGDVLVSLTRPNLNAVALVTPEYHKQIASTGFEVIKPTLVDSRYIFALVRSKEFVDQISGVVQGALYPAAKSSDVQNFEFLLPSLAEQKAIADKLDTLLAQVENTKARLERIPEILKRFRQSVLAAAVSGRLTEEWRGNNSNLELLEPSIKSLTEFRDRELAPLPDQWTWLSFEKVANIASNLVDPSSDPEAIHIAPNHIESGTGSISEYQTVSIDGVTSSKHRFYRGQILYSKIRPYLCKVTVAPFDGLCSADMYPISSKLETNYLYRWMLSSLFTDWASNAGSRSVLPKINQKDLKKIPVPTPPMQEQTEIVRRVDQLFAHADRIEQQVNQALARVNNLTQSILAKAFRGELTEQWRKENPELTSGKNSAEALLKRIKEERAAKAPVKRTRKKATA